MRFTLIFLYVFSSFFDPFFCSFLSFPQPHVKGENPKKCPIKTRYLFFFCKKSEKKKAKIEGEICRSREKHRWKKTLKNAKNEVKKTRFLSMPFRKSLPNKHTHFRFFSKKKIKKKFCCFFFIRKKIAKTSILHSFTYIFP